MNTNYLLNVIKSFFKTKYEINYMLDIWVILETIFALVLFKHSGLSLSLGNKVTLLIILLVSLKNRTKIYQFINEQFNTKSKKISLFVLYAYAAFSLVGHRLFIFPLDNEIKLKQILIYALAIIFFVPIVNSVIYYIHKAKSIICNCERKIATRKFVFIVVSILLVPSVLALIAFNPGISTYDTYATMVGNAKNIHGMFDWHPFFYSLLTRKIEQIWDSTYAMIFFQWTMYIYIIVELLVYLRSKKINEYFLIAVCAFIGFSPANYLQINTIWKDIPYTMSLLWSFVIISKLTIDKELYKKKLFIYLEFIIALAGVYLFRKNGIVTFWLILICLIPLLLRNIRLLYSSLACLTLIFIIQGPLYNHYEVKSSGNTGIYIGLGQDILGVHFGKGSLSETTKKIAQELTNNQIAQYDYNPTWSNISYHTTIIPKDFILAYIETFTHNPILMTKAIIAREEAVWNIFLGEKSYLGCVNLHSSLDQDKDLNDKWIKYYPKRQYSFATKFFSKISNYIAREPLFNAVIWRTGLFFLIGIIICSTMIIIDKQSILNVIIPLFSPVISHIIGLILSCGWSDFRYFWPINLLVLSIFCISFVTVRNREVSNTTSPIV